MDNGITVALTRLAALRSTMIDRDTLVLFTKELAAHPQPDDIIQACERLAHLPRADGETAFPSLGAILEAVRIIGREQRILRMHWSEECAEMHGGRCTNAHFHDAMISATTFRA